MRVEPNAYRMARQEGLTESDAHDFADWIFWTGTPCNFPTLVVWRKEFGI